MRNRDLGAKGKAVDRAAVGADDAAAVWRQRRRWSTEKKLRIVRESFALSETVTAVAARYGITRNRLSSWRSVLYRQGKLVAPSSARSEPAGAFAAVEVEERASAAIEGRGVTVRLERAIDTAGIAAIAVALAGRR